MSAYLLTVFGRRAACLLLFCAFAGPSALSQTPAQDKQPETQKPVYTMTGEYTEWLEGPESSSTRTRVIAADGSGVMIYDYVDKSDKRIKNLLTNCTNDAFKVLEDSRLPGAAKTKGVKVRTLALFRYSEGQQGAVLCRSDGKHMLTMITGNTIEYVLGLERNEYPQKSAQ